VAGGGGIDSKERRESERDLGKNSDSSGGVILPRQKKRARGVSSPVLPIIGAVQIGGKRGTVVRHKGGEEEIP